MEEIKMLRLVTGEDIICRFIKISSESYAIMNPMVIAVRYKNKSSNLTMAHWLPVEIVKKNEVLMHPRDILAMYDPIDDVAEYYDTMVDKLTEMMKADFTPVDIGDITDMDDIAEAIKQSESQVIH
jgi:hypothetical protein